MHVSVDHKLSFVVVIWLGVQIRAPYNSAHSELQNGATPGVAPGSSSVLVVALFVPSWNILLSFLSIKPPNFETFFTGLDIFHWFGVSASQRFSVGYFGTFCCLLWGVTMTTGGCLHMRAADWAFQSPNSAQIKTPNPIGLKSWHQENRAGRENEQGKCSLNQFFS